MLIRNMLLKYYAPESGGEGSGGGGIEITPEIQKLIDERVTSEVTGLKSKNSELLGTIKQQKENLSRFDGIDPDAVRGILQRFSDDEEAKLIAAGKIDEVLDKRTERMREKEAAAKRGDKAALAQLRSEDRASQAKHIDPLSEDDPSGSQVSHTITKTAMAVVIGILVLIVGMQIGYGVMRRLNTANLSESVSVDTVSTALKGGLEWGNGFTQFPLDFTVDEADERTGTVEVTVLDTSSANELELLSNGQIQAAALATNALLNDKIDRVVYNVHAYIDEDSNIQHDSFFGMFPARGHQSAILTFVWTKSSSNATSIDWKMRIVSMDDTIAERIQKQVNSVSSLIEDPVVSQTKIDEEKAERDLEHRLHGREIFRGGKPDRTPSKLLEQDKKK